jgi:two-component system, NarL family, sensor histidine kinase UhpB
MAESMGLASGRPSCVTARAMPAGKCNRAQSNRLEGTVINAQFASTAGPLAPTSHPRRSLHGLWYGRSIRLQLLVVFVVVDLLAALLSGTIAIWRARTQTRIEIAASVHLAELLVGDAAKYLSQQITAEEFLRALPTQLRSMRHVRIAVKDAAGMSMAPALTFGTREHAPAPVWFAALVAPAVEAHEVPVIVGGRPVGKVEIIGEPADEIAEVWENLLAIGSVAVLLNLTMICLLYILFGRVLDPLTALAVGLSDLQRKSYSVRLPPQPYPRELEVIVAQFNALARALEALRAENVTLNRRLIRAQDDERRRTALELHDEVGPCLFGLKVCASSIVTAAAELPEKAGQKMSERAREIVATVEHLQAINRTMLDRLRPMALGHVPLKEILEQLVSERARQMPQVLFRLSAEGLASGYGDSMDLTVYRCIQESTTNAIRHAQAKRVDIEICDDGAAMLKLTIRDDGRGMAVGAPAGLGIRGMQERVEGFGGRCSVESETGRGTCVNIRIPLGEGDTPYRSGSGIIGSQHDSGLDH